MDLHRVASRTPQLSLRRVTTPAPPINKMGNVVPADPAGILGWLTSHIPSIDAPPVHGALVMFRLNYDSEEFEPDTVVDISYALTPQWFAAVCAVELVTGDGILAHSKLTAQIAMLYKKAKMHAFGRVIGPYFMLTGPDPDWEQINWIWAYMTDQQKFNFLQGELYEPELHRQLERTSCERAPDRCPEWLLGERGSAQQGRDAVPDPQRDQ